MTVDPNQIATDAGVVINEAAPFASLAGPYGAAAVVAAQAMLAGYKALIPVISDLVNKGLVSVADQATLAAAYNDVAVTHATAFQGPEWKQD